jgi:hypothetical protein
VSECERERGAKERREREREERERERDGRREGGREVGMVGGRERQCYAGACYFLEMVTHSIFSALRYNTFARTLTVTLQIQIFCPQ